MCSCCFKKGGNFSTGAEITKVQILLKISSERELPGQPAGLGENVNEIFSGKQPTSNMLFLTFDD